MHNFKSERNITSAHCIKSNNVIMLRISIEKYLLVLRKKKCNDDDDVYKMKCDSL